MNRGSTLHRYSKETTRWLKEQGFSDAGAFYRKIGALSRYPKHRRWDREYDENGEEIRREASSEASDARRIDGAR